MKTLFKSSKSLKHHCQLACCYLASTNEERLLAYRQRLARHNRAVRNGKEIAFPLPIIREGATR
ncbi:hypothetical protein [Algicola sagamiensis]|uniref:hypothetical protein n=1 Tax=Algicola sagamiensis TaxID=163869 RepID=UPI0003600099|nr:hypothetical protein [Algicola sagamiensis]